MQNPSGARRPGTRAKITQQSRQYTSSFSNIDWGDGGTQASDPSADDDDNLDKIWGSYAEGESASTSTSMSSSSRSDDAVVNERTNKFVSAFKGVFDRRSFEESKANTSVPATPPSSSDAWGGDQSGEKHQQQKQPKSPLDESERSVDSQDFLHWDRTSNVVTPQQHEEENCDEQTSSDDNGKGLAKRFPQRRRSLSCSDIVTPMSVINEVLKFEGLDDL